MQRLEWDFENRIDDDELDAALSGSPEVLGDRFGVRTALLVLCIALFIAAIWLTSRPSFEKCSGLENVTERNACYDELRKEFLKPPAKGADVPKGWSSDLRFRSLGLSHIVPDASSCINDRAHADKRRGST